MAQIKGCDLRRLAASSFGLRDRSLRPQYCGWASRTARASLVLDALNQALYYRRPVHRGGLIHHRDRVCQYFSINCTEPPDQAGIEPSVGSVSDNYDADLAETINCLYRAELIDWRGPWRSLEVVEFATSELVN